MHFWRAHRREWFPTLRADAHRDDGGGGTSNCRMEQRKRFLERFVWPLLSFKKALSLLSSLSWWLIHSSRYWRKGLEKSWNTALHGWLIVIIRQHWNGTHNSPNCEYTHNLSWNCGQQLEVCHPALLDNASPRVSPGTPQTGWDNIQISLFWVDERWNGEEGDDVKAWRKDKRNL